MKNLYFKAQINFNGESIPITTPEDLEKALYLFQSKKDGFIGGRPIRGVDIITVKEDWNRELGVAPDWKLDGEDHAILARNGAKDRYAGIIGKYTRRVEFLIGNGMINLVGKKADIPQLDNPINKEFTDGVESVANKMKI